MATLEQLDHIDKKDFYSRNIFHERQMNSCPIGCQGCAVSASSTARGAMKYQDLLDLYHDAYDQNVRLRITKVEGYDPVFVNYADDDSIPFAQSIVDAINLSHQIITPVCTTGHWKSDKSKWQLEELGKLSNHYRRYTYPSGNKGVGFALSVPREIRPYANGRYDYDEHLAKVIEDINLLTINGNVDVLIYYNNQIETDYDIAIKIKANVFINLGETQRERCNFMVTNFNDQTLPESCFRYPNSVLVSSEGYSMINPNTLEWEPGAGIPVPVTAETDKKLVAAN